MKGLIMKRRSRYWGLTCFHCHGDIRPGQSFLGHTLFVIQGRNGVMASCSSNPHSVTELRIRFGYHRHCIEKILLNSPLANNENTVAFEAYREMLRQQYGAREEPGDEGLSG